MSILHEVALLEEKLISQSSVKELAFYSKLTGHPYAIEKRGSLSKIEQICVSAFCDEMPISQTLVEQFRRSKPIKGMHYANNLIELLAFVLIDFNGEEVKLLEYISTASPRDRLIINSLFPNYCDINVSPNNSIDTVALWVSKEAETVEDNWQSKLLSAAINAVDLLDLYVIRQGYLSINEYHPAKQQLRDLKALKDETEKLVRHVEKSSAQNFNINLAIISIPLFCIGSYYTFNNWDFSEPLTFIIPSGFAVFALVGWKLNLNLLISRVRSQCSVRLFRKMGVDIKKVKYILSR